MPDVVVTSPTNLLHSKELEYLKAAKALNIPTVVPVLTWDNLTTKGLLQIIPSLTLVWNNAQADEAKSIHSVLDERLVITGSPFLDKWRARPLPALPENEFREHVGLQAGRPYVLYLGSSRNIAEDESWLVERLAQSMINSRNPRVRETHILVRPHGGNQKVFRRISQPNVKLWFRNDDIPDSQESLMLFASSLTYSICCFGLNTTGMVDALLADKPVVTLLVDEYKDTNAAQAVHYKYLLTAGVYYQALTTDEGARVISDIIENGDVKEGARRKFKLEFVWPNGLESSAGDIAAEAIEMAAQRRSASYICKAIKENATARAENGVGSVGGDTW